LAIWTNVRILDKEQNSYVQSNTQTNPDLWNTTVGYGFHFKHRNPGKLPIKSFAHDCRRTLVRAEYGYPRDLQTSTVKEEIRHCNSEYNARFIVHPNDLVVRNGVFWDVMLYGSCKNGRFGGT
jgi:hypothetical protein